MLFPKNPDKNVCFVRLQYLFNMNISYDMYTSSYLFLQEQRSGRQWIQRIPKPIHRRRCSIHHTRGSIVNHEKEEIECEFLYSIMKEEKETT